jgi:predicted acyl esterase
MPSQTRDLLKVDEDSFPYIFEQNVTVALKSSDGLVRVNVYRPKTQAKVPVLVTYGPYGKDIPYEESVLRTVLWRNQPLSGL